MKLVHQMNFLLNSSQINALDRNSNSKCGTIVLFKEIIFHNPFKPAKIIIILKFNILQHKIFKTSSLSVVTDYCSCFIVLLLCVVDFKCTLENPNHVWIFISLHDEQTTHFEYIQRPRQPQKKPLVINKSHFAKSNAC